MQSSPDGVHNVWRQEIILLTVHHTSRGSFVLTIFVELRDERWVLMMINMFVFIWYKCRWSQTKACTSFKRIPHLKRFICILWYITANGPNFSFFKMFVLEVYLVGPKRTNIVKYVAVAHFVCDTFGNHCFYIYAHR